MIYDLSGLSCGKCDIHAVHANSITVEDLYFAHSASASMFRGSLGDSVVVVRVWRGASLSDTSLTRFIDRVSRELSVWKSLSSHPNLASFVGVVPGFGALPSLVLPYYQNGDINEFISKNPQTDILHLLLGANLGLAFMHSLSPPIIHGKVKGSNILITDEGTACLTDIGISNMVIPYDLQVTGGLQHVRWMAPEVMNPDQDISDPEMAYTSTNSDVYSFGMTILEVFSKRNPFAHRRNVVNVIRDVVSGLRPPRPACAEITDDIWNLIQSCWQQKPSERPNIASIHAWLNLVHKTKLMESYLKPFLLRT